jgi:hypothetical protein
MRTTHLLLAIALVACGKSENDEGKAAATDYVAKSVKDDIVALKAAIASPNPGDGKYKCAHMANIDTLEAAAEHKAMAAELRQLCTKDLYLAMMKVEVEKAEAARKAKPDEKMLGECYNANFEFAKKEMTDAKTVDAAKDLIARFDAACPPQK